MFVRDSSAAAEPPPLSAHLPKYGARPTGLIRSWLMLLAVEDLVTTEPVGEFTLEASGVQ